MKLIRIIALIILILGTHSTAGLFDNKEQTKLLEKTQEELAHMQESKGNWQIIAGLLGIGTIVLFIVGTALGSTTRRHGNPE